VPVEWTPALRRRFDDAPVALGRSDAITSLLPNASLLLYSFARKEAVLSSQIEGTQSSLADLLLFEINEQPGVPVEDALARPHRCDVRHAARLAPVQWDADSRLGRARQSRRERVFRGAIRRLSHVAAECDLGNFIVRPRRRVVERFKKPEAWIALTSDDRLELSNKVAGLPSELEAEPEEAKRFDLLLLNLQLAVLRHEPAFERLRDQVKAIAGLLEGKSAIPMVHQQMPLIQDLQTDEWWQDATTPMLESVRRRLRDLVRLIDKQQRKPIYTDFEDEMVAETGHHLFGVGTDQESEEFRAKARVFLRAHQDHIAIHKLRTNRRLTPADLAELERMLAENGLSAADQINRAKAEFVSLIVDHLTEHGVMDAGLLYESPFTDLTSRGPDALFTSTQVDELVNVLDAVLATARAA
jgi:type I restriction enzyme R subunit